MSQSDLCAPAGESTAHRWIGVQSPATARCKGRAWAEQPWAKLSLRSGWLARTPSAGNLADMRDIVVTAANSPRLSAPATMPGYSRRGTARCLPGCSFRRGSYHHLMELSESNPGDRVWPGSRRLTAV